MDHIPQDIRLWLLTAHEQTSQLEPGVPLPVSHDAFKRGLVCNDEGTWVLTGDGKAVRDKLL
jgi:hypothetical protein